MNTTLERIKSLKEQIALTLVEIATLEVEIEYLIKIWLRESSISFDAIEKFSIEKDFISVERLIYGRWGGNDETEYTEIPISYFEAENPEEFIQIHLKEKQTKEEAEKKEEIAKAEKSKEEKERATYEKLKAKFEK